VEPNGLKNYNNIKKKETIKSNLIYEQNCFYLKEKRMD